MSRSVNARELDGRPGRASDFDLVDGDLSFISLTLVLPALVPLLKPGGDLLMLVKPQFELQPGQVGKRGIVQRPGAVRRGRAAHARRLRRAGPAGARLVRQPGRRRRRQPRILRPRNQDRTA